VSLRKLIQQYVGESIEFVKRRIINNDSPLYNFFDAGSLRDIAGDHLEGKIPPPFYMVTDKLR